jgi:hypothetical protein
MLENYLIKKPEDNSNEVDLWSTSRLPFEPKGWHLEMRNTLRSALTNLIGNDHSTLRAIYSSEQVDFCDTENILIYNVGQGAFKGLCQKGIILERRIQPIPPSPIKLSDTALHHHRYSTDIAEDQLPQWKREMLLATWNDIPCPPLRSDIKPHHIWHSIKKGSVKTSLAPYSFDTNYYGISVEINAPNNIKLNLAGIIKPLLDGIISAFHSHEGKYRIDVSELLADKLRTDKVEIQNMLSDVQNAVLGSRNLIHPFGKGIQWNPADDLFMQIEVTINNSENLDAWNLSGEIYKLEKAY